MGNQLVVCQVSAGDLERVDAEFHEHVDGRRRKRRRHHREAVKFRACDDFDMCGAVELELLEELSKRSRRHMGRSRTVRGHEFVGLERLHLHGGGAGGRRGVDHRERFV